MKNMKRNNGPRRIGACLAAGFLTASLGTSVYAAHHHAYHASGRGVTNGRQEYTLAGIRIGDTYSTVLRRFGNPTETQLERITLVSGGGVTGGGTTTIPQKIFIGPSSSGATGGIGGGPGAGGPGGGFPGTGPGAGPGGGYPGGTPGSLGGGTLFQMAGGFPGGPPGGFPGGFPGAGGGFPGAGGGFPGAGGGFPGAGGGPGAGTMITPDHPEYRWIYDEPSASSLEFTFSPNGHVVQIRATGFHGIAKTLRGVMLGMKSSQVILAYGNPEKQNYDGSVLTIDYVDSAHVSFQFYNQRLVGITVAQVD